LGAGLAGQLGGGLPAGAGGANLASLLGGAGLLSGLSSRLGAANANALLGAAAANGLDLTAFTSESVHALAGNATTDPTGVHAAPAIDVSSFTNLFDDHTADGPAAVVAVDEPPAANAAQARAHDLTRHPSPAPPTPRPGLT
jgi:hypothetical protein